jgi:hypothetical protein
MSFSTSTTSCQSTPTSTKFPKKISARSQIASATSGPRNSAICHFWSLASASPALPHPSSPDHFQIKSWSQKTVESLEEMELKMMTFHRCLLCFLAGLVAGYLASLVVRWYCRSQWRHGLPEGLGGCGPCTRDIFNHYF